jgi:hypothetical protein
LFDCGGELVFAGTSRRCNIDTADQGGRQLCNPIVSIYFLQSTIEYVAVIEAGNRIDQPAIQCLRSTAWQAGDASAVPRLHSDLSNGAVLIESCFNADRMQIAAAAATLVKTH